VSFVRLSTCCDPFAVATSVPEATWPCGVDDMAWGTAEPLRIQLDAALASYQEAAFLRGTHVFDEAGTELPLVVVTHCDDVALCARDGLQPSSAYTWTLGPWDEPQSNSLPYEHDALPTVLFRTNEDDGSPAADGADCAALATEVTGEAAATCAPEYPWC
jgi:hypothetical protein